MRKLLAVNLFFIGNVSADLVGHWLFNEGNGTIYADSSKNKNDASVTTSTAWSTEIPATSFANSASLDLDGTTQYLDTTYVGIAGSAPRTVSFWMKTTMTGANGIIAWGNSTSNGAKWHIRLSYFLEIFKNYKEPKKNTQK